MRGLASRRPPNLTDYLVPPEEMELDDDNDSLRRVYKSDNTSPPPPHLRQVLRSTRRESWGTLRDASPNACHSVPFRPV